MAVADDVNKRARRVGRNIVRARDRMGVSQNGLAKQLEIDRAQLMSWERGRYEPSSTNLARVADALEQEWGWFYIDHGSDDQ